MYLRFVVADIDEDSAHELGVFHAASNLQAEGLLYAHEEELYDTVRTWFDQHLEKPTRFTAAKSPFTHKQKKRSRGSRIAQMSILYRFGSS